MDAKQAADTLDFMKARLDNIEDLHQSDFMYFSQWIQDLDKRVKGFEATLLRFEKTAQFSEMLKPAAPVVVTSTSKVKIALAIGVGVYVGIKVNEALKPKKGQ